MNLALLFKRPDKPRRVFQLARARRCATVPEVEHLIQSAAAQRSRPRIDCFLGKRNAFQSEAILEILKASGFSPAFSPGVGRALNEDEIFHLANFLDVLRLNYESDEQRREFYRIWRDQLVATGPRDQYSHLRGLPNLEVSPISKRSKLLSLFKRNDVSQAAGPFDSPTLTAFLQGRSAQAGFGPTRERLDVGGWQSTSMFLLPEESESALIERAFEAASKATATPISPPRILICGWYGTETLGDKAILGGIVEVVRRRWPMVTVDLASLEPYVSRMTVRQMPELRIHRVLSLGEAFAHVSESEYCAVAIGGGPLMSSIPWCTHLLELFAAAKQAGSKCLIAACGLGPLFVDYRNPAIKHLLEIADEVVLRDAGSKQIAHAVLKVNRQLEVALDPAFIWVRQHDKALEKEPKQILLALRDWPIEEFAARLDRTRAQQIKTAYESELVAMIAEILRLDPSLKLVPFCMHKYAIGGDDRIFYRRLLSQFPEILCRLDNRHRTPAEDLDMIARSRAILAMRFHSVVFSLATNTPFLAVDYTLGGKIAGLLDDLGARDSLIPIDRFDGKNTARRLLSLKHPIIDVTNKVLASAAAIDRCFASVPLPAIGRAQRDLPSTCAAFQSSREGQL
jgi:polysaccharide pyruvyl transferase WcaK-like protein